MEDPVSLLSLLFLVSIIPRILITGQPGMGERVVNPLSTAHQQNKVNRIKFQKP